MPWLHAHLPIPIQTIGHVNSRGLVPVHKIQAHYKSHNTRGLTNKYQYTKLFLQNNEPVKRTSLYKVV